MPAASDHEPARPRPSAPRVLVVDDDEEFAQGLSAVLEAAGHDVRVAFSASEALELLSAFVPDVAIADLCMPVVDGFALLAILRADANLSACTFIAISGDAQEAAKADAFDHFFMKPFEMRLLIHVLESRGNALRAH